MPSPVQRCAVLTSRYVFSFQFASRFSQVKPKALLALFVSVVGFNLFREEQQMQYDFHVNAHVATDSLGLLTKSNILHLQNIFNAEGSGNSYFSVVFLCYRKWLSLIPYLKP